MVYGIMSTGMQKIGHSGTLKRRCIIRHMKTRFSTMPPQTFNLVNEKNNEASDNYFLGRRDRMISVKE